MALIGSSWHQTVIHGANLLLIGSSWHQTITYAKYFEETWISISFDRRPVGVL